MAKAWKRSGQSKSRKKIKEKKKKKPKNPSALLPAETHARACARVARAFRSGAAPGLCTLGPALWLSARDLAGTSVAHSPLSAMPGGVPWSAYLKMLSSSLLAMCAGAQAVHWYYRPDLTIPEIPPKPGELKTELLGLKEKPHKPQISQQ